METLDQIVDKFVYSAIQHGLAMKEGGGRKANRWLKKVSVIYQKIAEIGCEERLKPLLNHENEYVRLSVACLAKELFPDEAEKVLKKLTKSSDPYVYISARCSLDKRF